MGGFKKIFPKSLPLQGFITGKKSFDHSLRSDGSPLEQTVNKRILKLIGREGKKTKGGYLPKTPDYLKNQPQQFNYNPSGFMSQIQAGNQASIAQNEEALAAANAAQQANIKAATNTTQVAGGKPPVTTSFAPANNFSAPNLSGLTFGGK